MKTFKRHPFGYIIGNALYDTGEKAYILMVSHHGKDAENEYRKYIAKHSNLRALDDPCLCPCVGAIQLIEEKFTQEMREKFRRHGIIHFKK